MVSHTLPGLLLNLAEHRSTEGLRLIWDRTVWPQDDLVHPSVQAGSPRATFPGLCWAGFWTSSQREALPTSLDNLCQCAVAHTVKRCFLSFQQSFLYCACCLLSCHWSPLSRAWVHLLYTPLSAIYTHRSDPPSAFFRLNTPSSLSLSPYIRHSSPLIVFVALHWPHSTRSMSFLY